MKIQMICSDMAGTTIDHGSCAPAGAFVELFRRNGVTATLEEARRPMGQHKRDHIRHMTKEPSVARQWQAKYGRPVNEADVEKMFQEFIPLQLAVLPSFCTLIPGVVATVAELKHRGLIFTTSTGYNREMTDICLQAYEAAGILPAFHICAAEVAAGRPAPDMALRAMQAMQVAPEAVIKIGDTISDIQEGLAAKTWSIGITATGNMLGLNLDEYTALPTRERQRRLALATEEMKAAGAHYVIERFSDLPEVIDEINRRLAAGETP